MSRSEAILERLATPASPGAYPEGLPVGDFVRSPAAQLIGEAAAREGLILAHYEHRHPVDEGAEPPSWDQGTIPEPKYTDFRHDLPIGSFHPGHRAKWSTHEFAHLLIGFAWSAEASPLTIATAARVAELFPVVLWYFFDEVGLRRCPRHEGPLFRAYCPDCEAAAAQGPRPIDGLRDRAFIQDGLAFVDRELAAVARTLRSGQPVSHIWGSLDLCSDGLAYADHHLSRLNGPAFRAWADRFFRAETGGFDRLDDLIGRVEQMVFALGEEAPLPRWGFDRSRYVAMDLAARLLDASMASAGDVASVLPWVDALAEGADPQSVARELEEASAAGERVPDPDAVFATGYRWRPEPPRATVGRIEAGLRTVVPCTLDLYEDAAVDPLPDYVASDPWVRRPVGERFAGWLSEHAPAAVGTLAFYEAALRHVKPDPFTALGPDGEGLVLAGGVRILRSGFDVIAFAEAVEAGEVIATADRGQLTLEAPEDEGEAVIVARDRAGSLVLALVSDEVAAALETDPSTLPDDEIDELLDLQVVRRRQWMR
ncbi:MAG: hypothetical protein AAGA48_31100 [Myxococcota bacterium]